MLDSCSDINTVDSCSDLSLYLSIYIYIWGNSHRISVLMRLVILDSCSYVNEVGYSGRLFWHRLIILDSCSDITEVSHTRQLL